MNVDREVHLLLGRPYLATGKTTINVEKGEVFMKVDDHEVTMKVVKDGNIERKGEDCSMVSIESEKKRETRVKESEEKNEKKENESEKEKLERLSQMLKNR